MADFYVTADGGSEGSVQPVAKAMEAEGVTVETGVTGPNAESLRNDGTVKPPTKLVFICNGGQAGQTYGSFALDYSDGMCFTIFAFDNYATHFDTTTEDAIRNKPLVSEHDSGDFATDEIAKDIEGHTSCSYQQKYSQVFAFIADEQSAESLGKRIVQGDYTCGSGGGTTGSSSGGGAQVKDKTFEHCIRRICAATDSIFLVENNAAVLFPYTDWMAYTLRQKINTITTKQMDPDLFSIEYNNEGFYNKVTTVYGADEESDDTANNTKNKDDKNKNEEKTTDGKTTKTKKSMPTGGTQISEQYDPLVKIYGELEKKVTTNFPDEETAQYVANALLIQYVREFNNSCRIRALHNTSFIGGTFYNVQNPNTKQTDLFYLNSYVIHKDKDEPITVDMEFKYGPEGAEELLDYQAYATGSSGGGSTSSASSTEEQIWQDAAKCKWAQDQEDCSTNDPATAKKHYDDYTAQGKEVHFDCFGMSAYLYYRFNNEANIPARVIGSTDHKVIELYKNNEWYKPIEEYRQLDHDFHYDDATSSPNAPVLLPPPNDPSNGSSSSSSSNNSNNK